MEGVEINVVMIETTGIRPLEDLCQEVKGS
jgi:hypothetical protein